MECYICFEKYTDKSGLPCEECKKTCCGNCYMIQYINRRTHPKCGLCRHDPKIEEYSLTVIEMLIPTLALECGFDINEAIEFREQVEEMQR